MKKIYLLFILLLITGCSIKHPQIGKKSFPKEDEYIIKALVDEDSGDYADAAKVYLFLYKKTDKIVYFRRYLDDLFELKKYNQVIKEANNFLKQHWDDEVFKIKIFALLEENKLNEAKNALLKNFNKKNTFFYSMMSYILTKQGKYLEALEYAKSNYALNPTKQNLLNLVDILIKNKKYTEAIAYLNTYLKEHRCDYEVCLKLAHIYKELYDYNRLANIYVKLGRFNKKFYLLALNYYMNIGEYQKAINLIKKYNLDEEYLMYIYEQIGKYKKAALVAMNLYLKTKNIKYFLKYTIYIYKADKSKKTINEVIKNLKFISKKINSPFVYNFLGYLLIDKNINPKEGIKYVQKALKLEPDNIEYIDSLAWGYYKLKQCKIAWKIIKNIHTDDETILYHKKLIKRCLNDTSKNNKSNKKRFRKKKK